MYRSICKHIFMYMHVYIYMGSRGIDLYAYTYMYMHIYIYMGSFTCQRSESSRGSKRTAPLHPCAYLCVGLYIYVYHVRTSMHILRCMYIRVYMYV